MASEKLIETKLRLSAEERDAVLSLKGDRGMNVCFRRAIQQWVAREQMLQEAVRLGHRVPGLYPDAPIPQQPANPPTQNGHPQVTPLPRNNTPVEPTAPVVEPSEDDDEQDEEDQSPRRRPPTSAETWGAGGPDAS